MTISLIVYLAGLAIVLCVLLTNPSFFKNWVNRKAKINELEDVIANRDALLKQQADMFGELMKEAQMLRDGNLVLTKKCVELTKKIEAQEKIINEFGAFAESVKKYKMAG